MDHRERVLAAVNHEEPDRVPVAINGSAYGITDPLYFDLLKHLNLGDPIPPFRRKRGHSVNYHDDRLMDALDIDVRYAWLGFTDLGGPEQGDGMDAWGIGWEQAGIYLTATEHPLLETTIDDLERFPWPDVEQFIRRDELRERAKYLK